MSLQGIASPKLRATSTVPDLPLSGSFSGAFHGAASPTASGAAVSAIAI
jgi:hypothetical protein